MPILATLHVNRFAAVGMSLALAACSHYAPYEAQVDQVLGTVEVHGVTVKNDQLYSYSSLPGVIDSDYESYEKLAENQTLTIFAHRDHLEGASDFINVVCCSNDNRILDNLVDTHTWVQSLFKSNTQLDLNIVLVPSNYSYNFVSNYQIKNNRSQARFAFHYDISDFKGVMKKFSDTLAHELTHIYFTLGEVQPENPVSDEAIAHLVGLCAATSIENRVPNNPFSVLPKEEDLARFREGEYRDNVSRLSENNSAYVVGLMAANLLYERFLNLEHDPGNDQVLELVGLCEKTVAENHDFMKSLPR